MEHICDGIRWRHQYQNGKIWLKGNWIGVNSQERVLLIIINSFQSPIYCQPHFNHGLIMYFCFDTDDVIWCCHKCVPWLIIFVAFTSWMYWFKIMVYLKIMLPWLIMHRVYKMFDWFAGGSFCCSSALCTCFYFTFWTHVKKLYNSNTNMASSI